MIAFLQRLKNLGKIFLFLDPHSELKTRFAALLLPMSTTLADTDTKNYTGSLW